MWLDRSALNRQGLRKAEALFEMLVTLAVLTSNHL